MSGAADFANQLRGEWEKVEDRLRQRVTDVAEVAIDGLVDKSPVATGRFKGNWKAAIGEPDYRQSKNRDKSGQETKTALKGTVAAYETEAGLPGIYLTNNLPYASELEDGRSGQAPGGMVGLTVAELEAMFDGDEV